jgi:hypothetical protein
MEPAASGPAVLAWVHKRDGRLVPFEADKISRALFAATEDLGRPDAFLARELTDGVVHFLVAETEGAIPSTAQVAEVVVKVVRELGQPALAQSFADGARQREARHAQSRSDTPPLPTEVTLRFSVAQSLPAILQDCRRTYTLHAVFARDLVAAQRDGLLTLMGLETPFELTGCVLGPQPEAGQMSFGGAASLVEQLVEVRQRAGQFVVLDGPEHTLRQAAENAVASYRRELEIGLRATGLTTIVNLNSPVPPSWADDLAEGPLFAGARRPLYRARLATLCDELAGHLLRTDQALPGVRLDWHLAEPDLRPEAEPRLLGLARAAIQGASVAFVFDRPRRPVPLAEGIDRQHPATLLTVALHLPRLAAQVIAGARREGTNQAEPFIQKVGSLVRLALSAAVQKRDFLRRHSSERTAITRGFLLERARLVVAPVGLESVVQMLTGRGLCSGGPALELGRQIVQRLRDVLHQDGQACRLQTCVDAPPSVAGDAPGADNCMGLTPCDGAASIKSQLRAAGAMHAVAEHGTAVVQLEPGEPPTAEQVVQWLRWAWQQTDVVRVRLVRPAIEPQQLTVPWPEEKHAVL